jgi:uncharacterized lipoprotein YddW (UPF0748 family)
MRNCLVTRVLLLMTCCVAEMFGQSFLPQAPKREVRAVWITTANGLDWPKTTDRSEQQSSLRKIVADLNAEHFNTIFFQVRARGDAYFHSTYEPWAENLTGTLGKDPGWDPLSFLIDEAHRVGLEVHAWFNVFKIRGMIPVGTSSPPHPSRAHVLWTVQCQGETWLDPGIPDVRSYLLGVALELVKGYDIDGLNLDYIRYPGRDFADEQSYRHYGSARNRDEWRRNNVTAFVSELYERATALKPMLKVGSSPLGVYEGNGSNGASGSFSAYYQDSQGWIRAGKQDYLAPQIYWPIGSRGDPDFAQLVLQWQRQSSGRHIYAGIGAYKPEVARQLAALIDTVRASSCAGEAFYRLESINGPDATGDRYRSPAFPPPMAWKDSIPPLPPKNLTVTEISPSVYHLEWSAPPAASDGDRARRYIVYRWSTPAIPTDNPRAIAAITSTADNFYVDSVSTPVGIASYYAVASLDKGNNESLPSNIASATVREALALQGKLSHFTTLSTSVSNGDGTPAFAGYHLGARMPVALELYLTTSDARDTLIATLVNAVQDEGAYVYGLRRALHTPGIYLIRLKAGGTVLEQNVEVGARANR